MSTGLPSRLFVTIVLHIDQVRPGESPGLGQEQAYEHIQRRNETELEHVPAASSRSRTLRPAERDAHQDGTIAMAIGPPSNAFGAQDGSEQVTQAA